jgi:beta-lactamase class A
LSKQIPGLLQEQLAYLKSEAEVVQILGADETIQPGVKYPVEDLLRRMLVYSDNNSYYLLSDYLNKINQSNAVNQTLLDLGVVTPNDIFDEAISTRRYASILRTLYTSSYLSPDDSEKILGWLAEAKFNDGLRAGVAAGVPIAHKFGVRDEDGKEPELHDCGIVYFPKNPYILCVMTRGKDYAKLADTIKTVSGKVYGEIDSRRINP